jgi:hypothetical protein
MDILIPLGIISAVVVAFQLENSNLKFGRKS